MATYNNVDKIRTSGGQDMDLSGIRAQLDGEDIIVRSDLDSVSGGLQTQITELELNQNDLITLTGVAENSTNLGTFTGTTITDNSDIKAALQELETAVEAGADLTDVVLRDGTQAFTGSQSMGSNNLTDLAAPVNDNDAARKVDVDAAAAGMLPKSPVRVASTADVGGSYLTGTISGLGASLAIDGVSLANGDRVLLKDQSNAQQNGIYVYDGTDTLTRSEDMDGTPSNEVQGGNSVFVNEGTAHADNMFRLDGTGILTLDTDNLNWIFFSRAEAITASTGLTKVGLDVRLADAGAANGIAVSSGVISAQVDDTTIEISGTNLAVKDGGISEAKLGSDVDAESFVLSAGYAAASGTVTIGDTIEVAIEKVVGNLAETDANIATNTADISANTSDIADIRTTQGTADGDTNLGTFTGTTITDSNTVKGALQELETAVETKADSSTVTEIDANVDDLITLTGMPENSTNLGTFTGTIISDNVDIKTALQELESSATSASTDEDRSYVATIDFNSAATVEIIPASVITSGDEIFEVRVKVITAFDGTPTISVGNTGNNILLADTNDFTMNSTAGQPQILDIWETLTTTDAINCYYTAGSATVGQLKVSVRKLTP